MNAQLKKGVLELIVLESVRQKERTMTDEDFRQRVQASYLESRTAKTTPEL